MKTRNVLACVLAVVAMVSVACAPQKHAKEQARVATEHDAVTKVKLTDNLQGSHYKDIYFSKQPAMSDFDALKKQGFTHVINLRHPSEYDEAAERAKLQELGIQYDNIPFSGKDELTDQYIDSVTQVAVKYRSLGKTLVHCSSSNRVGLWVGGHFYKDHHFTKELAIETAKNAGVTSKAVEAKLEAYLSQKQ